MARTFATYLFLLSILSFALPVTAEETIVHGTAIDFAEKPIHLIGYIDHFTNEMEVLATTEVAADGGFELRMELSDIRYVQLRSDGVVAQFYIQPGADYDLSFSRPEDGRPRAFSTKLQTEVLFNDLAQDDINARIIAFNTLYDRFFNERYDRLTALLSAGGPKATEEEGGERIAMKSRVQRFDELGKELVVYLDSAYGVIEEPYFAEYVNAVKAEMRMKGKNDRVELYDMHLKGHELMLHHPEQTKMFTEFFGAYFDYLGRLLREKEDLTATINEQDSASVLLDLIAQDELVETEKERQLLMIHGLKEIWDRRGVDKQNVRALLLDLQGSTPYEEIRVLASSTLDLLTKARVGYPIKDLTLRDASNDTHRLSDYADKPLVLHFWTSWSQSSQREIPQALELEERYGESVRFVHICMDEDRSTMDAYILGHPEMDGIQLFGGDRPLLAEQYSVYALPTYHVLEEDGIYLRPSAPLPSEGLENILYKLTQDRKNVNIVRPGEKRNGP